VSGPAVIFPRTPNRTSASPTAAHRNRSFAQPVPDSPLLGANEGTTPAHGSGSSGTIHMGAIRYSLS